MFKRFIKWWHKDNPYYREYLKVDSNGHVKVDSAKWFASPEFRKAQQEYLDSDFYKFHFGKEK